MNALVINLSNMGDVIAGHVVHQNLIASGFKVDLLTLPAFTGLIGPWDDVQPRAYRRDALDQGFATHSYDVAVDLTSTRETRRLMRRVAAKHKIGRFTGPGKWVKMRPTYRHLVPKFHYDHVIKDCWLVNAKLDEIFASPGGRRSDGTRFGFPTPTFPRLVPLPAGEISSLTDAWWPAEGGQSVAGLHFGASVPKRVLPQETMDLVITTLARRGRKVFLVGTEDEAAVRLTARYGAEVFYRGLSLPELRAAMSRFEVFVGPDSGPLHLAAALGRPAVGIYGPNTPARSGPLAPQVTLLESELECRPCAQAVPCPIAIQCIKQIPPSTIVSAIDAYLRG